MPDSSLALVRVRRSLERLEPRRATTPATLFPLGHEGIDSTLGGGIAQGRLHEIFADEEGASSAAGVASLFCLCAGIEAQSGKQGTFLWLRTEAGQKKAGNLYATGLGELGLDPARLLLALVPDEAALLHAAAEATRCAGLSALLVECWGPARGLDLTASRRLMLAAENSAVTVFLLRIAAMPSPSAADTRWRVSTAPSALLEGDAPGLPMFELELLRRRAGPPAGPWRVEWDRDRLCFRDPGLRETDRILHPGSPLSGPVLPLVAGGTPALLRRAG